MLLLWQYAAGPTGCQRWSLVPAPLLSGLSPLQTARRMEGQRRNIVAARRLYRQALQADPGHCQSILGLGQLEARSGNPEAALKLYQQGLAVQPRSVHLLSSLAHLHTQVGSIRSCMVMHARRGRKAALGTALGVSCRMPGNKMLTS